MTTPLRSDGLCVLVAEDCAEAADSYAVLLRLFGHRVHIAADGSTAVRLAKVLAPDVALIDIVLPQLDGYAVARALARNDGNRRPLLVAITGYSEEDDVSRAERAGFDLHLSKPVDPEALLAVLRRFEQVVAPAKAGAV